MLMVTTTDNISTPDSDKQQTALFAAWRVTEQQAISSTLVNLAIISAIHLCWWPTNSPRALSSEAIMHLCLCFSISVLWMRRKEWRRLHAYRFITKPSNLSQSVRTTPLHTLIRNVFFWWRFFGASRKKLTCQPYQAIGRLYHMSS